MKKVVVIDGQGGKIGTGVIAALRESGVPMHITAIGTNSAATANMLKSQPDAAATGENPVLVACRRADVIAGPIGIVIADSLFGEITPGMALAVGQSSAARVLIPVNKCDSIVVGCEDLPLAVLIRDAVSCVLDILEND